MTMTSSSNPPDSVSLPGRKCQTQTQKRRTNQVQSRRESTVASTSAPPHLPATFDQGRDS